MIRSLTRMGMYVSRSHGQFHPTLGLYSLSGKTSYRKISWILEAARFGFKLFQSLWNLAGTSAALLPRCLTNFRAIRPLQHPISRLRDVTRFGGKTSYRLVNRGPAVHNSSEMPPLLPSYRDVTWALWNNTKIAGISTVCSTIHSGWQKGT